MRLTIAAGSAHPQLAEAIARALERRPMHGRVERFPDGELHVLVEEAARGDDVYLVQPTCAPAGEHLLELLLLADACRRAGAARLTAVVPYFGYARHDRRARHGEPLGVRVVADALRGFDRLIAVDLHNAAVDGCFDMPLQHLSAVPPLAAAADLQAGDVVVAPDLGAMKLAERWAQALRLPIAVVHKVRLSGHEVQAERIVGEVRGRRPILVDDMISTGGTIAAAARVLLDAGCAKPITVAATHGLFVDGAEQRLAELPIARLLVSDSVPPRGAALPVERVSLAPLVAEAIARLHRA